MAKIIAGILKPTEGKIFFDGEDITDWSVTDRAKAGSAMLSSSRYGLRA